MKNFSLLFTLTLLLTTSYAQTTLTPDTCGFIGSYERAVTNPDPCSTTAFSTDLLSIRTRFYSDNWYIKHSLLFFDLSNVPSDAKKVSLKLFFNRFYTYSGGNVVATSLEDSAKVTPSKFFVYLKDGLSKDTPPTWESMGYSDDQGFLTDATLIDSGTVSGNKLQSYIEVSSDGFTEKINAKKGNSICIYLVVERHDELTEVYSFGSNSEFEGAVNPPQLVFEDGSSIQNSEISMLNLYPNPASNEINIDQNYDVLRIIDITGKIVKVVESGVSSIRVSDLNSGLYFVKLEVNNETYLGKVMIK